MKFFPRNKWSLYETKKAVFTFFGVGVVGFTIPFTQPLFVAMTPLALLISIYLLALYHPGYSRRQLVAIALVYLLGFGIEVVGVQTGLIFGNYCYGSGMGIKIWGTPLLIGANWLFLAYCCTAIVSRFTRKWFMILLLAPLLLLSYDILMEQLAPIMDMWSWAGEVIPIRNYAAWWVIGTACIAILLAFKVPTNNPLAAPVFIAQFLFFLIIFIFYKLFF